MIVSVASGKGGTGKTTVAVSLALSIGAGVQLLDCDAEEPNAHIFLRPVIGDSRPVSIPVPVIDEKKCTYCGRCREVCAYHAIAVVRQPDGTGGSVLIFPNLCHGCGSCAFFCPEKATTETPRRIGIVETGIAGPIRFGHGRLDIGEAMAPPVIRGIKRGIEAGRTIIIDAPPGTSCPVVEAVRGSDYCVLVTEPTPFGLNDLVLAVGVLRKLAIPFGVVINRAGLGDEETDAYCRKERVPVLMRIPFKNCKNNH